VPGISECADCQVDLVDAIAPSAAADEWVVIAQHMLEYAWVPIDGAGFELLALEDGLRSQGIDSSFLPYRPGESGGFTDALRQPLQLLVRREDVDRAQQVAVDLLGADCDMLI
jgi:hypothetical protein